jgi:hypothetical protein
MKPSSCVQADGKQRNLSLLNSPLLLRFVKLCTLGAGLLAFISPQAPAHAAESIVFNYRWLQRTVSVDELSTFAETGEPSEPLAYYLGALDEDPDRVRQVLTQPITIDPVMLDRGLNHPLGYIVLDQLTPIFHTESGEGDRQALRAALVLSASDDETISIIELLQNYPTQELYVEGEQLIDAYTDIAMLRDRLNQWTAWLDLVR